MKKLIPTILLCACFFNYNVVQAQLSPQTGTQTPVDTSFLLKINGVDQYLEIKGVSRAQYFETINAPKKKLFWFEHSGHSPSWEEPAFFYQRVVKIAADCKTN